MENSIQNINRVNKCLYVFECVCGYVLGTVRGTVGDFVGGRILNLAYVWHLFALFTFLFHYNLESGYLMLLPGYG